MNKEFHYSQTEYTNQSNKSINQSIKQFQTITALSNEFDICYKQENSLMSTGNTQINQINQSINQLIQFKLLIY